MGERAVKVSRTANFIKVQTPSGSEDVYYSLFYEGIPEEFLLEAQKTLNETEENKQKGMKTLRAFAKREGMRCTDDDLVIALRSCKYDIKKSENKLRRYLKLREKVLNLVSHMDDSKTDVILDDQVLCVLPYRDKHGRIILYARANLHLDLYEFEDTDPLFLALILYLVTLPLTTVTGMAHIGDCKTDNMLLFYPILKQTKKTYVSLGKDLPVRIARLDILNTHFLARWCYTILRPIIPEKLSKRIHFHGSNNYETLKECYDPEILPEELGGNLGPFSDKHFRQRLLNFIQNLKEENKRLEKNK